MTLAIRLALVLAVLLMPVTLAAQYSEIPRPLPQPVSDVFGVTLPRDIQSATQIGRRLFVASDFTRLATPTSQAVVVGPNGRTVPGGFPYFVGPVDQIVPDAAGGWLVVGGFTSVNGEAIAGFARVAADRSLDRRFKMVADGRIRRVAVAHGRVYLFGDFTTVNGAIRRGLAALDGATGTLSPWGADFDPGVLLSSFSFSSIGVYVAGGGHVWGFDAASGRRLFRVDGGGALAATSQRVYVNGQDGYRRPVRALDPLTGQDTGWSIGATFDYIPASYGWDGTEVTSLLTDGSRLYIAGRFRSTIGESIAAVDATTGQPVGWHPSGLGALGNSSTWLTRVGRTVFVGSASGLSGYDTTTAARVPLAPDVVGSIATIAAAPEGVVVGGALAFGGGPQVGRTDLAAIDLDTGTIDAWTSAFVGSGFEGVTEVASDGQWLFARTGNDNTAATIRLAKIDPASGAIAAERTFRSLVTRMRVSGGDVVVATTDPDTLIGEIGLLAIADWSYRRLVTAAGTIVSVDADGARVYLTGSFATVGGQDRPRAAAVDRTTGTVLPWRPAPAGIGLTTVRASGGRVWLAGDFHRVGGARRLGLAELDPSSGAALPWNPHVTSNGLPGVAHLEVGPDGVLYASGGSVWPDGDVTTYAAGQIAPSTVAYDLATGARLPWRPTVPGLVAVTADCLVTAFGCLPRATPPPTSLRVAQSGASIALTWALASAPERTGVRLEFGRADGSADLATLDLPADQAWFSATAPPGRYFARVRALAGPATSRATADVSFSVGPPDVPGAPLDLTAVTAGPRLTLAWQPPSTGAPPAYEIEAGAVRGARNLGALVLPGNATTFSLDVPAGEYWLRVSALNGFGRSAPSNEARAAIAPVFGCATAPPRNLTASVSGRVVTLAWQPADEDESPPVIVAGSAPGLSDLASVTAPPFATSFSATVPPGVYYVRLRTGCFTVYTSNEVQVVVP